MARLFPRRGSFAFIAALGIVASVGGCDCGETETTQVSCKSDADCLAEAEKLQQDLFCDLREGICVPVNWECKEDWQCCAGQICAAAGGGSCNDTFTACIDDSSCTVRGQKCKEIGELPRGLGCTFERAGAKESCPAGLSYFNGFCVGEPPCENGTCPAGTACVPANNKCHQVPPKDGPKSCEQSCGEGHLLVFVDSDYDDVFNRCNRKKVKECSCEPLPAVPANDLARHSSAANTSNEILVAAYDGTLVPNGVHGDLILRTFDKATLTERDKSPEWIDGVPTSGAILGDPSGPRGGRSGPGPDVGQYTSIAVDSGGVAHIAYYAKADGQNPLGDLRYARRSGTSWQKHVVDGRTEAGSDSGDVGLYTSITLAPDGAPVIAYFQKSGVAADRNATALKVARAKKKDPSGPADWTIVTVQAGTKSPVPCTTPQPNNAQYDAENKQCKDTAACVTQSGSPNGICRQKAPRQSDCKNPSCDSDEVCALGNDGKTACFPSLKASTLAGLPEGNGLMPSIGYLDNVPVVVWYDENTWDETNGSKGRLKGAIASSDSASAGAVFKAADVTILDDGAVANGIPGARRNNVGLFPSLAVGGSDVAKRLAVSFFDATTRTLKVLTAKAKDGTKWDDLTPAGQRTVDTGKGTPETDPVLFVGADTSLRFDAQKNLVVAYQDSTRGDLRVAYQLAGGQWSAPTVVSGDGVGGGFFANLLVDGANKFVTHAIIKAASASESANKLEVKKLP